MNAKRIAGLIVFSVLSTALADLSDGLVAWYSLKGTLTNQINPNQIASLMDGAALQPEGVVMNAPIFCDAWDGVCAGGIHYPAPLASPTSVFTASLQVYETGLTDTAGGSYLVAGALADSVQIFTHNWVNRPEGREGSYYELIDYGPPLMIAPLQATSIRNRWVHYVFVSDTNEVRFYKDGVRIASTNTTPLTVSGDWFSGKGWWFTGGGTLVYTERILGKFKNMRVYSRPLSDQDVAELYDLDSEPQLSIEVAAVRLRWFGRSNVNYQVQRSPDFQNWSNLVLVLGTGAQTNVVDWTDDGSRKFYRLVVVP